MRVQWLLIFTLFFSGTVESKITEKDTSLILSALSVFSLYHTFGNLPSHPIRAKQWALVGLCSCVYDFCLKHKTGDDAFAFIKFSCQGYFVDH